MATKIVVLGMVHYPKNTHYLSQVIRLLEIKGSVEFISFENDIVSMYDELIRCSDTGSDKVDDVMNKYLNAIDNADALLIINPSGVEYEYPYLKQKSENYSLWVSYLAGYAYSQGVPCVLFANGQDVQLHPCLYRQIHAILQTVQELQEYDFSMLVPKFKARLFLPS